MSSKRFYYILLSLTVVLVVALGYGYKIGLDKVAEHRQNVQNLKAKIAAVDEKLDLTIQTQNQLEQLGFIDTIAKEVIPNEKSQPEVLAQLLLIADKAGVNIESVNFISSGVQVPISEGGPKISQAERIPGVTGVLSIPMTIQINGRYDQMLSMIRAIEQNRRKMQTSQVSIRPIIDEFGNATNRVQSDIVVDVYVRAN